MRRLIILVCAALVVNSCGSAGIDAQSSVSNTTQTKDATSLPAEQENIEKELTKEAVSTSIEKVQTYDFPTVLTGVPLVIDIDEDTDTDEDRSEEDNLFTATSRVEKNAAGDQFYSYADLVAEAYDHGCFQLTRLDGTSYYYVLNTVGWPADGYKEIKSSEGYSFEGDLLDHSQAVFSITEETSIGETLGEADQTQKDSDGFTYTYKLENEDVAEYGWLLKTWMNPLTKTDSGLNFTSSIDEVIDWTGSSVTVTLKTDKSNVIEALTFDSNYIFSGADSQYKEEAQHSVTLTYSYPSSVATENITEPRDETCSNNDPLEFSDFS